MTPGSAASARPRGTQAAPGARWLVPLGLALTGLVIGLPLAAVFAQAFAKGLRVYGANLAHPDTLHAIWLTVVTALLVVPVNLVFGLAAAWAITKFRFRGKKLLTTLIELPLSVSPIVAGVIYLLVYGGRGLFGPTLNQLGLQLMFSLPGIVLVCLFITSPFIVRELIPLMEEQGTEEEEAAVLLGASGWQTFWRVTLPNIRWALLYGVILCNARTMGEFGGVSVVSGNIRGQTNTLPLHVELLYHDYNAAGAFAAASILTLLAVATLVAKAALDWISRYERRPRIVE